MRSYAVAYIACLVVMTLLDAFWLGVAGKSLYKAALGSLIADKPNMVAAGLFYAIYPLGIVIFAVRPGLEAGSWQRALVFGLLFGFFNYATYDLTNWAVVKTWPGSPLLFDLPWGTALTGTVATAAFFAARMI